MYPITFSAIQDRHQEMLREADAYWKNRAAWRMTQDRGRRNLRTLLPIVGLWTRRAAPSSTCIEHSPVAACKGSACQSVSL